VEKDTLSHYKVAQGAHPQLDGHYLTICGVDLRKCEGNPRHIPPCDEGCAQVVVNCPKCLAIYDAIAQKVLNERR
jgi:hypothetical protein